MSLKLGLEQILNLEGSFLLVLSAVAVSAWFGGWIQGTLAAVLSLIALETLEATPLNSASVLFYTFDSILIIFVSTHLQRAREARNRTEGIFRAMFDSNVIGFVMSDSKSNILDANDYYLKLLGLTREDLNREDLTWLIELHGASKPFEKEYIRKDGRRVSVLVGAIRSQNLNISYVLDVSDRKAAERELSEAKNRLEENVHVRTRELLNANRELSDTQTFLDSVIENIPNMIFVKDAKNLSFIRLNRAGEELLGYSRLDLLGKSDHDFFPAEQAEFFVNKDREVLKGKAEVDIAEEPITTKSGTRYLHTKKIPILDKSGEPLYLLGISEDVTEKKAVELQRLELAQAQSAREAAELSNRRLSSLSEASAALTESLELRSILDSFSRVIVKNMADWCIVDVYDEKEHSIERMVARSGNGDVPTEVRDWWARHPFDINAPDGTGYVIRTGQSRVYNKMDRNNLVSICNDKNVVNQVLEWHISSAMIVPLAYHGKVLGTLCFVLTSGERYYDGFDLSMAQDLAKRAALAIENANLFSKANEASRAKSAFLANISHEIRTPLGAMLGFAELALEDKGLETKHEAYISTIARNGRQLLRLVDEILDLSKVESERIQIEQLSFSLPSLLKEVHSLLRIKADERGLALVTHGTTGIPERVKSDPLRLRQILINVIGNAIKFTEKGQITVTTRFREEKGRSRGVLEIQVRDTGIGMDEEQRARIFQPFVQADGTMTRKYGGTGLGLFLARKLARLMGGDVILLGSRPNSGSEFQITLNVDVDHLTVVPSKTVGNESGVLPHNTQIKVLVVEDSPDNRMLISAYLAASNANLEFAENGATGVEKALANRFDLILMDIQMPEMDGYEALQRLRDSSYNGPVVALTAHAMKGDRERCLTAGFNDYLCKPVSRKALIDILARYAPRTPPAAVINH
jgi:PAS domain S-box-containing protein